MKPKHIIVFLLLLLTAVSIQHVRLSREHKAAIELTQQALGLADSAYTNACEALARGSVTMAGALGIELSESTLAIAAGSLRRDVADPETMSPADWLDTLAIAPLKPCTTVPRRRK